MGEGCSKPVVEIPSAPSNLQATRMTCTSIKLTWYVSDQPWGFYLYRKCGNGEYEKIAEPICCEFYLFDVPEGVQCTYYITAYDGAGESEPSNEVSP